MRDVRLTSNDVRWATEVGHVRWRRAQQKGSKAKFKGATEAHHMIGAGGELAFCRALGLVWPASIDSYSEDGRPDVYPNWEIRTAPRARGVKVTESDPENRLVAWVLGDDPRRDPSYTIMGYIRAGGAKRHVDWFKDYGDKGRAYWKVPEWAMVVIDERFHRFCGFALTNLNVWACVFCGKGSGEEVAGAAI